MGVPIPPSPPAPSEPWRIRLSGLSKCFIEPPPEGWLYDWPYGNLYNGTYPLSKTYDGVYYYETSEVCPGILITITWDGTGWSIGTETCKLWYDPEEEFWYSNWSYYFASSGHGSFWGTYYNMMSHMPWGHGVTGHAVVGSGGEGGVNNEEAEILAKEYNLLPDAAVYPARQRRVNTGKYEPDHNFSAASRCMVLAHFVGKSNIIVQYTPADLIPP